jgi:hypothetical protein
MNNDTANIPHLKQLNSLLSPDKQIKMLLFLHSKFSKVSQDTLSFMPDHCRKYFHYISIDNSAIREKIKNSESVKINTVPCIIVVDINNNVSLYESDKLSQIINFISNASGENKPPPQPQQMLGVSHPQQQLSGGSTPLSSLIDEDTPARPPSQSSRNRQSQPSSQRTKVKAVPRRGDILPPHTEMPEMGRSTLRNQVPKGVGHEKMARSSLGEIDISSSNKQQPPMGNNQPEFSGMEDLEDGEIVGEDLDDILNEDPTLDPDIKKSIASKSVDKKESMDSVKRLAMEMQQGREIEEE